MKFLPTENITYKTSLKENEIIRRLSENLEPEKALRFGILSSASTKPYEGHISGNTFEIKRIIRYQNTFLPRINGIIESDFDGITIKVKMRLHVFVLVFLSIWCGGVAIGCIAFLSMAFFNSDFSPAILIPFGMLIFAYALTMGAFKYESIKSKKDLQTMFEADIIEQ